MLGKNVVTCFLAFSIFGSALANRVGQDDHQADVPPKNASRTTAVPDPTQAMFDRLDGVSFYDADNERKSWKEREVALNAAISEYKKIVNELKSKVDKKAARAHLLSVVEKAAKEDLTVMTGGFRMNYLYPYLIEEVFVSDQDKEDLFKILQATLITCIESRSPSDVERWTTSERQEICLGFVRAIGKSAKDMLPTLEKYVGHQYQYARASTLYTTFGKIGESTLPVLAEILNAEGGQFEKYHALEALEIMTKDGVDPDKAFPLVERLLSKELSKESPNASLVYQATRPLELHREHPITKMVAKLVENSTCKEKDKILSRLK